MTKVVLVTEPYDQLIKTTVNLGFRPKYVNIKAVIMETKYESDGVWDGVAGNAFFTYKIVSNETVSIMGSNSIISFWYDSSNNMTGIITLTDTGLEITWEKIGTLTGASGNRRLVVSGITH